MFLKIMNSKLHLLLQPDIVLNNLSCHKQTSLDSVSKPQQTGIYVIPAVLSHVISLYTRHANLFRPFIINLPECHIQCQTQTPKHSSALLNHMAHHTTYTHHEAGTSSSSSKGSTLTRISSRSPSRKLPTSLPIPTGSALS